jgi:tetratricopeptide (TPR) repeat protein
MPRPWPRWAISLGLLAAFAAGPAAARSGDVRACADQTESAAAERIAACTTLLKSRGISGKPAGVAYALRGLAYLDRGDIPNGISDLDKAIGLAPDFAPAYQNRGNAWYARGNFGRAIADYDKAIELDASNASAYANRATVRRDVGYTEGALEDYAKAISLNPRAARTYTNRGQLYLQQANYANAAADFDRALQFEPSAATYLLLGKARTEAEDYNRALAAYGEASRLDPQAVAPINAEAGVYARKGEFDKALALYDRALKMDPNAPATYRARAEVFYAKGDHKRALKEIDRVLKFTWNANALKLRAEWRLAAGDTDGAMADVGHIDKLDPDGSTSLVLRGALAARKRDYAAALTELDKAVATNGKDPFALRERGLVYAAKGDSAKALSDLNRAIEVGATDADLYRSRAKLYAAKGDNAKARADFDQAITRDPANAASYFDRAALRKASGDSNGQMADLNEGLKRQPNNALALYERGLLKNMRNDVTGALADFDSAIKLEPTNNEFLKSRAMARASVKNKGSTENIAALYELISLEPGNARNYYRRGLAYMREQDADKARADFKMALAKDRRMKEAARALDRLAKESRHWTKKPVEAKATPTPETVTEPKVEAKAPVTPADSGPPDDAVSDRKAREPVSAAKNTAKNTGAPQAAPHASNERRQAQRHPVETRRPQVRYYYYRNGRQVSFSEAFR